MSFNIHTMRLPDANAGFDWFCMLHLSLSLSKNLFDIIGILKYMINIMSSLT